MIDEQFLETIPRYGIGGLVGKFFKNVKKAVKKVAPIVGGGIGFMIGGAAGAGIGAGIGGLVAGQKPEQALQTAMLGYGIGNLAGAGLFGETIQGWGGQGIGGFGAMGSKGQILPTDWGSKLYGGNLFSGKTPPTFNEFVADKGLDVSTEGLKAAAEKQYIAAMAGGKGMSTLGKVMTGTALASIPLTYLDAKKQAEDMGDTDPSALNPFYYQDPQQFQLANVAGDPYYYPELQEQFGVPVEDLPTEFIRSAEGGTVQLGDGTRKNFPRRTGPINGPGTGKSDSIPAMLSDGEFVMTADAVRNAGGGDRRKGAKRMYNAMKNLERRAA